MQNCKKIVLIQYQNLHKCRVKRPVSLAWPLHTQSAGTSAGVTAVHTHRDRNTTIGIELCKQYRGENNMAREQTAVWAGGYSRNHAMVQNRRLGSAFPTQGEAVNGSFARESNAGSEALH